MKTIDTGRLIVRNFKSEDWQDLQEYLSMEGIMEYEVSWDAPFSVLVQSQ